MSLTMRFGSEPRRRVGLFDTRIRAAIRRCIADEVERLVDMLDALDADPDLESSADEEPSLWFATMNIYHGGKAATDDREDDAADGCEVCEDQEPALGWTGHEDQTSPQRHGEGWRWGEDER